MASASNIGKTLVWKAKHLAGTYHAQDTFVSAETASLNASIPKAKQLGNLSSLQFLDLSYSVGLSSVGNLEWLSHLSSLSYLDLAFSNLSKSSDWFQVVNKLPFLRTLLLQDCNLPPIVSSPLSLVNSTSLLRLDLSSNTLTSSMYPWLFNVSNNLGYLDLSTNQLQGSIPDAFGRITSLTDLYLSYNQLEGGIPESFGNMCLLHSLDLSDKNLGGKLSKSIRNLIGGCTEGTLEYLYLNDNKFIGSVTDLSRFKSLKVLQLEQNLLNGTLTNSIGLPYKLEVLVLRENSLEGEITEAVFSNLSNLVDLDLAVNSLVSELRPDWIPPFQLRTINLAPCKIGPHFPKWLQTQKHFESLDISNAGMSDSLPEWFLDLSSELHFSSNHFEGPILALPSHISYVDLSKNKFSGTISTLCFTIESLLHIDLSSNLLSVKVPNCWKQFNNLQIVDFANNNFSGKIPDTMGTLSNLQTLSLRNNRFFGELPLSLKNCTKLRVLDLEKNALPGRIPEWIGESLQDLIFLSLLSNNIFGNIPLQLCRPGNIQLLDLSFNNISATIPKCFNNFSSMTYEWSTTLTTNYFPCGSPFVYQRQEYFDNAVLKWKESKFEFKNTLGLIKMLDLSSNILSGEVSEEIMSLTGLVALNLSRNNLSGEITLKIGDLKSLDFLDLSRNQFSGEIPPTLSLISGFSVLDLSNNNLSGRIPSGTQLQSFNSSVYGGNPGLCGLPLPTKCSDDEPSQGPATNNGGKEGTDAPKDDLWFYLSSIIGFVVGFWGVCGTLLFKASWRHAYFNFLIDAKDWVYVTAVVSISKLQTRLSF
ncbi:receptor-like protein EIX2 [Pistacia vera]|uniref:receptor-like protein EIX2 n=1 Tax=Pistacia vera TaxID=55513 RepID=UPI001262BD61|nr:receptor-like protein EIX2 [Pistacia vera]